MIDLKLIRDNPSFLDEALKKRGQDGLSATVLKLDKENREIIKELQTVQEERNEKSKKIGELSASGKNDEADKYKNEVSNLKVKLQELEVKQRDSQKKIDDCLSRIPNIPDESVPVGDESFNKEIKVEGNKKKIDFEPKEHFELGENLNLMSFDKA